MADTVPHHRPQVNFVLKRVQHGLSVERWRTEHVPTSTPRRNAVKRRYFVALAPMSLIATACGSSGSKGSTSPTGAVHVELVSVGPDTDSTQTILRTLMDGFAKTNPGSTFKNTYIPQNQLDQKLQLLSAQNALPEMYFAPGTPAAQTEMAKAG